MIDERCAGIPSGRVAWQALVQKYEGSSSNRVVRYLRQLMGRKMTDREDIDAYLGDITNWATQLSMIGCAMPEAFIILILLIGLPASCVNFTDSLQMIEGLDVARCKREIRAFWSRRIDLHKRPATAAAAGEPPPLAATSSLRWTSCGGGGRAAGGEGAGAGALGVV